MIDLIDIEADHVLAVRLHQNVLDSDIELAMNFLEKKVRTRDHIALYAEIDDISDIDAGVALKELKYSVTQLKELAHIDRAALVTDNATIRSVEAFAGLIPTVEIKTYPKAQAEAAKSWVSEPLAV